MKTILFLVIAFMFMSCTENMHEGDVVDKTVNFSPTTTIYFTEHEVRFFAPKGLYNVGDTVKFKK